MFYLNEEENGLHCDSKRETADRNDTFPKAVGTTGRRHRKVTLDVVPLPRRFVHTESTLLAQTHLAEKGKPHWRSGKEADLPTLKVSTLFFCAS